MKDFIKYQSLGNDFVIFDWYKKPASFISPLLDQQSLHETIKKLCDRHFGVGADNVLILTSNTHETLPEVFVFNADGSRAQTCLNGLRCIAHHLLSTYNFPASFAIKMGCRHFQCQAGHEIVTSLDPIVYQGLVHITAEENPYDGHVVMVGNPHFIIFKPIELDWLAAHGSMIESHPQFPEKTNVEFVWQEQPSKNDRYTMVVYERGCGPTLACSSGVSAVTGLLYKRGAILPNQKITISMPGGTVTSWVDAQERVFLSAQAQPVFKGTILLDIVI